MILDAVSRDDAVYARFGSATREELIAMAAEMGIALTEADFEQQAELDEDELEAVAGGKECVCVLGGGGETRDGECRCWCVAVGGGCCDECPPARLLMMMK